MTTEEDEIGITIESLTGTIYELTISVFETILAIKARIQRLEGIPVFQQQLVYKDSELLDDFCLQEYNIPHGARLQLLLTMRGGPIHASRMYLEDSFCHELDSRTNLWDSDKKVTLIFVKDGEMVQVFDPTEGNMTPCTESLSGSGYNGCEDETSPLSQQAKEDQQMMMKKVQELQRNLMKKRKHAKPEDVKLHNRTVLPSIACKKSDSGRRKHSVNRKLSKLPPLSYDDHTQQLSRQSVQCKEATPPALQSKKFARPPSCARRHLVFDNDTQFNSIDSGFVEEYILQPQPSDEQAHFVHSASKKLRHDEEILLADRFDQLTMTSKKSTSRSISNRRKNKKSTAYSSNTGGPFLPPLHTIRKPLFTTADTLTSNKLELPSLTSNTAVHNKKRKCTLCGKKTRIAATYTCRCGLTFCAMHRYAEEHNCSYDYKTEGRELLTQTNPVVTAPKLPKI